MDDINCTFPLHRLIDLLKKSKNVIKNNNDNNDNDYSVFYEIECYYP